MEVYWIVGVCILASFGLYSLMRRNQNKDQFSHLNDQLERHAGGDFSDDLVGSVKVIPIEEYQAKENDADHRSTAATQKETQNEENFRVLTIYLSAGRAHRFMGYELMQSLMAQGLQAGPMNIVHRYDEEGRIIFSVASATESGIIDLTNMGDFHTPGLCLFINLEKSIRPRHAFNEMVDCALQLADELNGQLLDPHKKAWTKDFEQSQREALPVYQPQTVEA